MTMCILAMHAAVNLGVKPIMPTRIMPTGITRCMAKAGKGYTDAENERLRAAALAICDERYDGHRTRMADALGIGQPSLSKFLNGNNGAGPYLAEAIAEMAGVSLKELLTGKPAPSVERPKLSSMPGWEMALRIARRQKHNSWIPNFAWRLASETSALEVPRNLTPEIVAGLAAVWAKMIEEDDSLENIASQAEMADIEAAHKRELEEHAQGTLPVDNRPPIPKARGHRPRLVSSPTPPPASTVKGSVKQRKLPGVG